MRHLPATAACLAGAFLAVLPLPAAAQPSAPPATLPTRDVSVAYRVAGAAAQAIPGGVPGLLTLRWNAAGQRLRADAEGRTQAAIVDLPGHRATVLEEGARTAMVLPFAQRDVGRLRLDGARFIRQGAATVAGLPCTTYAVQHSSGRGTLCLTADGVPLRAEGEVDGKRGSFTAERVEYGPLPPELFRAPDGYLRLDLGNMAGFGAIPGLTRPR